ncbi:MAG TPA: hypothetical protein VKZ63_05315 [Kofleriaceae bacterium]|nr:hypothetical protein [Kofleriaceae bacterium]
MTPDAVVHLLAFAVRAEDHFTAEPVDETLDVTLDTGEPPVTSREGGTRHGDGTYRWANLPGGARRLTVRSTSGRWVRWDPSPIDLVIPVAEPTEPVRVEMWPTPRAAPVAPALRGKLVGAAVAGLRVEIRGTGDPATGQFTRADEQGELLYPLAGRVWPMDGAGRLDLTVVVPGRTVSAVAVWPDPPAAGDQLLVPADRTSRVLIHVT